MPLSSPSEAALPAAWTDVLDRIQHVLAEALRAAEARARALEAEAPAKLDGRSSPSARALSVQEKLDPVASCDELGVETERALATAQEAVDRWLATAAQTAQRLADLATRAV